MSSIVLRKSGGFYCVYGDDAFILYYLFNYKIMGDKVGFPINALNKVINKLDECKINYEIVNENIKMNFKRNNYKKFLELGKSKHSLDYRINNIIDKIKSLTEKDIDKILCYIEGFYE